MLDIKGEFLGQEFLVKSWSSFIDFGINFPMVEKSSIRQGYRFALGWEIAALAWSVVQTHPNCERKACLNLRRQEFDYFNPRINERVRLKRGGISWRRVQLFKDYVFVNLSTGRWRALKSTIGISQVLMIESEKPAIVPDLFIHELRMRQDPDTGLVVIGKSKFNQGQTVQVKDGPYAYVCGLYDGQRDADRVYVLLQILGSERRVEMLEDNLIAA